MKSRNCIEKKISILEGKIERTVNLAYHFKSSVEKESRIDDLSCRHLALVEQLKKIK